MIELTQQQRMVRQILIEVASDKSRKPIPYSDLLNKAGIDWNLVNPYFRSELGDLLGAISVYENQHGRPMLSSVTVTKGSLRQSDGFYKLAEKLGKGNWQRLKERMWGFEEMNRTFDYWRNQIIDNKD